MYVCFLEIKDVEQINKLLEKAEAPVIVGK